MALHGTFEVNGRRIGQWDARRLPTPSALTTGETFYEVGVEIRGEWIRGLLVAHRYADGPLVLAAKALSAVAATDHARKVFATPSNLVVAKDA